MSFRRRRQRHPWRWNESIVPQWDTLDGTPVFRSHSDTPYRVYDRAIVEGKGVTLSFGDPAAGYRVFVPQYGRRIRFVFADGESHATDAKTLGDQLARASRRTRPA